MIDWLVVGFVGSVLFGASVVFGFFESPYDLRNPYDKTIPVVASEQSASDEIAFAEVLSDRKVSADPGGIEGLWQDNKTFVIGFLPLLFFTTAYVVDRTRR